MTDTHFTVLDHDIRLAWTYEPSQDVGGKCAILLHGFSSSKNNSTNRHVAPKLKAAGFSVFRLDFMGCGESTGPLGRTTISTGVRDLTFAWRHCIKSYGKPRRICLVGSSFGATVGLAAADHLSFSAFSLKSPMIDIRNAQLKSRGKNAIDKWEREGRILLKRKSGPVNLSFDYVRDADKYNFFNANYLDGAKIRIVHGDKDSVAPYEDSVRFVSQDPANRSLLTISGAGHTYDDPADFETMIDALVAGVGNEGGG